MRACTTAAREVRSWPHDRQAFTQGLLVHDGTLYESTGLEGRSSVRQVRLETGEVLQVKRLALRRRADLQEVWPEVVDNLASAVRAGLSLPEWLLTESLRRRWSGVHVERSTRM